MITWAETEKPDAGGGSRFISSVGHGRTQRILCNDLNPLCWHQQEKGPA